VEIVVKFVEAKQMMKIWNKYLKTKLVIVFQYVKKEKEIEEI
jgi:hypothetical protein